MKIQALHEHTNFKGLYTDKSASNNGDWKMEYAPYSWEMSPNGKFGTAEQTELNIMSSNLPDNEKRYIETNPTKYEWETKRGRVSCRDIFGTEFYFHDFDTNKMRNAIDHVEAMSREDSLDVYNKKLTKFIELKKEELKSFISKFGSNKENIDKYSDTFNRYSEDYDNGYLERANSRKYSKEQMLNYKNSIKEESYKMLDNIRTYIKLRDSLDEVKEKKKAIESELANIRKLRESGNLIDISRRVFTYDPNKPLWDALQNLSEAKKKFVALPNKLVSVQELLLAVKAHVDTKDIPQRVIKYVDQLIMHCK